MTGGGGTFAALPRPVRPPCMQLPTQGVSSGTYSVDSFSEYSAVAVGRQPSGGQHLSSYQQQQLEEELFRDLFAGENEPESTPIDRKKLPSFRPPVGIQWATGATPSVPFPLPKRPHGAPTLSSSAPVVPRLNLSELVIARPHVEDPSAAVGANGRRPSLLGQVVEEDEEQEADEDDRPETDLQSDIFPPFRSSAFRCAHPNENNSNKNPIEQETLRFLERLDLKTVLHTPRPEVDTFFPTARSELSARVDADDGRSRGNECGDSYAGHQRPAPPLGPLKEASHHRPLPKSARKEADQAAAARLAHMESTYGTTKHEPRKARRETIDRLANPIAGYTSTLQALSPEQRRKRELALESTDSDNNSSSRANGLARRMDSPQKATIATPSLLEQIFSAAEAYQVAASSAGAALAAASPQQKPRAGHQYQPTIVTASNNQVEDQLSALTGGKSGRGGGKSTGRRTASLSARKQALKAKLQGREGDAAVEREDNKQAKARDWVTAYSTFLTQREDEEAELVLPPANSRLSVPPLQTAQRGVETTKRSHQTSRPSKSVAATSGGSTVRTQESGSKASAASVGTTRKRPSRPTRMTSRDKGDSSSRSGTSGRKTPHPPPRPSNGTAAAAPPVRQPNPRTSQRKPRDVSSRSLIGGAGISSQQTGRVAATPTRGSLPTPTNSKGRKEEATALKSATNRPTTPTAASILMDNNPTATKKSGVRVGRLRKDSESSNNNDSRGRDELSRGPRVRLVPPRRLSSGSVSVGSAAPAVSGVRAPTARRPDSKRAQSPPQEGRRAVNNGGSTAKTGRKPSGQTRTAHATPTSSGNKRNQRTAA